MAAEWPYFSAYNLKSSKQSRSRSTNALVLRRVHSSSSSSSAMGRRAKSTKKIQTRKKQVVLTVFKCPFCSHDEAVECKMCVSCLLLLVV